MSVNYSDLERALSVSKGQPVDVGYFVLKVAVEAFLASQKAYPVKTPANPISTPKDSTGTPLEDLYKKWKQIPTPQGCPNCGLFGAHYCVGRRSIGTGIEYWMNQPSSTCTNGSTVLLGRGDNLNSRGIGSSIGKGM